MPQDPQVTIPTPRGVAEPTPARPAGGPVFDQPGWLTLVEALDRFAAGTVARLEHQLTRAADRQEVTRLRRQRDRALALEAVTIAAVDAARRAPAPSAAASAPPCEQARTR
ncbi:hypothetical protein [Actinomycetospora soli]|uniref:hypothetical protein n=1 Tax=Actinomycetospora soli TaxID=2893887 RepID=UPI001E618422|nr:hypothetical protein [Actinomycetospora soli]MCD2191303.1 hypothetical protein [Actinomycetospora soli]